MYNGYVPYPSQVYPEYQDPQFLQNNVVSPFSPQQQTPHLLHPLYNNNDNTHVPQLLPQAHWDPNAPQVPSPQTLATYHSDVPQSVSTPTEKRPKQTSTKPRKNQMSNKVTEGLRIVLKQHNKYLPPASGSKWTWQQLYEMVQYHQLLAHVQTQHQDWINDNLGKKRGTQTTNVDTDTHTHASPNTAITTDINGTLTFEFPIDQSNTVDLLDDSSVEDIFLSLNDGTLTTTPITPLPNIPYNVIGSPPTTLSPTPTATPILPTTASPPMFTPPTPVPINSPSPSISHHSPSPSQPSPMTDMEYILDDWTPEASVKTLRVTEIRANLVKALNFVELSDARTKENIREVSPSEALQKVRSAIVYLYQYKKEYGGDGSDKFGFLAQQLQAISPELVKEQESGLLTIKTSDILALLAASIRELADSNDILHEKLARVSLAACAPIQLVRFEGDKLLVNKHALDILRTITEGVSVVGVCGQRGDGNSTLCNHLLQTKDKDREFKTRNTTEPRTLGVWMSYPINNQACLVLDAQGFDIGDQGVQVLTFLCLISNVLILCQKTAVTDVLLDNLNAVVEVHKTFKSLQVQLPSLIMLIKDAQLELDKSKKSTGDHFLYTTLDTLPDESRYKACSETIPQFKPNTVLELPRPDDGEFDSALASLQQCVARYSRGRRHKHGAALAQLIEASADVMRHDLPHIEVPTFAKLVECREAASTLFAKYSEGRLTSNQVLKMYEEQTQQVPKDFKEVVVTDLRTKMDKAELLRFAARLENRAKAATPE